MDNPYQPSAFSSHPVASGQVSAGTLQALAATRPWVRLCSIVGFIGTGFTLLCALGIVAGGAFAGAGGAELILSVPYLVIALIYLFPSIKLWKYGSSIVKLMYSSSVSDLEEALDQQRSFWKFAGIMIIVMFALALLGIVAGAFFGAAVARSL